MSLSFPRGGFAFMLFQVVSLCLIDCNVCFGRKNVTDCLEYLGNPYLQYYSGEKKIYARNIWDMAIFQDQLFLGAGNSSNFGPIPNAGPVPIISYSPKSATFSAVFQTNEEQIDNFFVFDNMMFVPGHDPKDSWQFGNIYMTSDGVHWLKKRTIPNAIHTYSLNHFKGRLWAGLANANGAAVAVSDDSGTTWKVQNFPNVARFYDFLVVDEQIYVVGPVFDDEYRRRRERQSGKSIEEVFVYDHTDQFVSRPDLTIRTLFPSTELDATKVAKISRAQQFEQKSIYLGGYMHNDHQFLPFGLYVAESLQEKTVSVNKVTLPSDSQPWDILVSDGYAYILVNRSTSEGVEVMVFKSRDLVDWSEVVFFNSVAFARSFALLQGSFYFGLGSEVGDPGNWTTDELRADTGNIVRVDAGCLQH
jgi:hypothetical protein